MNKTVINKSQSGTSTLGALYRLRETGYPASTALADALDLAEPSGEEDAIQVSVFAEATSAASYMVPLIKLHGVIELLLDNPTVYKITIGG